MGPKFSKNIFFDTNGANISVLMGKTQYLLQSYAGASQDDAVWKIRKVVQVTDLVFGSHVRTYWPIDPKTGEASTEPVFVASSFLSYTYI